MSATRALFPEFVRAVPSHLDPSRLYVSTDYQVMVHLCACGCGERVALPIDPSMWRFTFDGETISVHPSVGNVGTPCGSHYWIRRNQIEWSRPLTDREAKAGQARDRADLLTKTGQRRPLVNAFWTRVRRLFGLE